MSAARSSSSYDTVLCASSVQSRSRNLCGHEPVSSDLREPPRHRADATMSRRWRRTSTPSSRRGLRVQRRVDGVGRQRFDFHAARNPRQHPSGADARGRLCHTDPYPNSRSRPRQNASYSSHSTSENTSGSAFRITSKSSGARRSNGKSHASRRSTFLISFAVRIPSAYLGQPTYA